MTSLRLIYVIKYVADMDRAVAFHRDTLRLPLKLQSPFWTEFSTGDITLALHPASERNAPGHCQLGFRTDGLSDLYAHRDESGMVFTAPPAEQRGALIARFLDCEGAECSVSG